MPYGKLLCYGYQITDRQIAPLGGNFSIAFFLSASLTVPFVELGTT